MKHVLIVAHPKKDSFTMTMACAYADAAIELGHDVLLRDLYGMGFDPCLHAEELAGASGYKPGPDVKTERKLIEDADVFALFYPFWFNAPPAILKGYVDRVFGAGFGFEPGAFGSAPLLKGRQLLSVSSSGAPNYWVESSGAMETLRRGFDQHVASICGLTVLEHLHFGNIGPGIRADFVQSCTGKVRAVAEATARAPQ